MDGFKLSFIEYDQQLFLFIKICMREMCLFSLEKWISRQMNMLIVHCAQSTYLKLKW